MIGFLRGVVEALGEEELILDVNGVGYLVAVGARTLSQVAPGAKISLFIETHVREDAIKLYGFSLESERAWFARLLSVQGVGAKAALAILDVLKPSEVESASVLGDASAFERAKGVGKKLAQRMVTELKDKAPPIGRRLATRSGSSLAGLMGDERVETPQIEDGVEEAPSLAPLPASSAREDAISALMNLGYSEGEARRAAAEALRALGEEASESALIRTALKDLAR
ncbi:Holliday junction branch migration protein RuvA [Woodsholea maritima]|uniref:Holliday junction branch migration protein RuvA n=1 Tax=Woodsholea maritima TaxID=240237 RepID=UPI00037C6020|nr:Holliday junction branch migration protein RuvA [Woodsholea maritima]